MKKQMLKKSDVLREGYIKGLKKAQRIINEQLKDKETKTFPKDKVVSAWQRVRDDYDCWLGYYGAEIAAKRATQRFFEYYGGVFRDSNMQNKYWNEVYRFFVGDLEYWETDGKSGELYPLLGHNV